MNRFSSTKVKFDSYSFNPYSNAQQSHLEHLNKHHLTTVLQKLPFKILKFTRSLLCGFLNFSLLKPKKRNL